MRAAVVVLTFLRIEVYVPSLQNRLYEETHMPRIRSSSL